MTASSQERVAPFGDLGGEFDIAPRPKAKPRPDEAAAIDRLADEHGFPSREPPAATSQKTATAPVRVESDDDQAPPNVSSRKPFRHRTGRTIQKNLRISTECEDLMESLAMEEETSLGDVVFRALQAYRKRKGAASR